MPPAPAGVAENNSSPVEELDVIELWCTFKLRLWQYGSFMFAGMLAVWHEPGAALVATLAAPARYGGGNSPWPTLMPPESVPELLFTRSLAICRLWPQAWTKIPPQPCELLRMPSPSMLDGLHRKLLGNGLTAVAVFAPHPLVVLVV